MSIWYISKSLFSKCYVEVPQEETRSFYRLYKDYLHHITDTIYVLDADKLWSDKFNSLSFPVFKSRLAAGTIVRNFDVKIMNKVSLALHGTVDDVLRGLDEFFQWASYFLNEMQATGHRISTEDMKKNLPVDYNSLKKEQFVETFRLLYATNHGLGGDTSAYCGIYKTSNGRESFQLIQSGYDNVRNLYRTAYNSSVTSNELCVYCETNDPIVKVCEFLNSLGVADYYRQGGDQPSIFIRINNPYYLNSLIKSGNYHNDILESIYEKYRYSERIFSYFFKTEMTNKQRWDFIEAYFLGESEENLLHFV